MDWHKRYLQQAVWTHDLRSYLFERADLAAARRLLEVGCGTGAVISDLWLPEARALVPRERYPGLACGVDLDPGAVVQCRVNAPFATVARADGLALPFADQLFDIVYCHFFLLWVRDPLAALLEMKRVAARKGRILILAEPDYADRIDEPPDLAFAGVLQTRSLQLQGADVTIGAHIADLFSNAGIQIIETGQIQSHSRAPSNDRDALDEWFVLRFDLERTAS